MEIKISGTSDEIKELFQTKEIRVEQPHFDKQTIRNEIKKLNWLVDKDLAQ